MRPPKKLYTFEMAAEYKIYDSGGNFLYVWKAHELKFYMIPTHPRIFHALVSTAQFCKEYGN